MKFTTAGAESVPPAPWVKIKPVGLAPERRHEIGWENEGAEIVKDSCMGKAGG